MNTASRMRIMWVLVVTAVTLLAGVADAQKQWSNTVDGTWNVGPWHPVGVPASSDLVKIGDNADTTMETVTITAGDPAAVAASLYVGWRDTSPALVGSEGGLIINANSPGDTRLTISGEFGVGGARTGQGNTRTGTVTHVSGVVNVGGILNIGRYAQGNTSSYAMNGGTLNVGGVLWGSNNLVAATGTGGTITQGPNTTVTVTGDYLSDLSSSSLTRTHTVGSGATLSISGYGEIRGAFKLDNNGGNISVGSYLLAGNGASRAMTAAVSKNWSMNGGTFTVGGLFTMGSSSALEMMLSGGTLKVNDLLLGNAASKLTISGSGLLLANNANYTVAEANQDITDGQIVASGLTPDTVIVGGTTYTRIAALPTITITANDPTATEASQTTGQFTVGRGSRTDGDLTVNFTLASGGANASPGSAGDYTLSGTGLTWTDGASSGSLVITDGSSSATITVTPVNDNDPEDPETVIPTISSSSSYTVGSPSSDTVTITSDDVSTDAAPTIYTNGVAAGESITTNVNEDCGSVDLTGLGLYAVDPDGTSWSWDKVTGSGPANGSVSVNGSETNPVIWTGGFTYTPDANFNGTNSFVVRVTDSALLYDSVTVTVAVAEINDPPVNTAVPTLSSSPAGGWLYTDTWTNSPGTWNDDVDTNATYTHTTFTNSATFLYQWQWSNSVAGDSIADATNAAFIPNDFGGYVGTNVRVRVWCVDSGVPGAVTSAPVDSVWRLVASAPILAPAITNAGPLSITIAEDAVSTNLQAAFNLLATNTTEAGALTWHVGTPATKGTATVSDSGSAESSAPDEFTYQPTANLNGVDSFVLTVSNAVGGLTSNITVNVTIDPVNDVPTNTALPQVTGTLAEGQLLTATSGTWNDHVDTNASYSTPSITYVYDQWQRVNDTNTLAGLMQIATLTSTFTLTSSEVGRYVRIQVTATDDGDPGAASATATSVWSYVERMPMAFTNVADGRFNSTNTWTPNTDYPRVPGDTAVITAYVVTNSALNEVGSNVTVTIEGTGTLSCADPGSAISSIHSNATVNINTGSTMRLEAANVRIGCRNINLNGGRLYFNNGTAELSTGSILNVNSNSLITPNGVYVIIKSVVKGTGRLTLTADAGHPNGASCAFDPGSTWTGAWDIQGNIRMDNASAAKNMPGDVRVAVGKDMRHNGTGPFTFKGIRSGSGANSGYLGSTYRVGDGTPGNGKISPGDNGVGNITFTNYGGASPVTLVFTNGSTYEVDIQGTANTEYDYVKVHPSGTGTVSILSGSTLNVNLWRPLSDTDLYATIIDTVSSTGEGVLTGGFGTTNWAGHTNGWSDLTVLSVNNDLVVTGAYVSVNSAPVIDPVGPVTFNMNEDGGATNLAPNSTLTATDAEGDAVAWTNVTTPAHGTVSVNGSGTNPVTWTSFVYTLTEANWNGTDTFKVKAYDAYGGMATVTVEVVVAPVNDAPVCSAQPTVDGTFQENQTVTNTFMGAWSDATDTAVSGTSVLTTNRQWQLATDINGGGAANITDATNETYTIVPTDVTKYLSVQVTCTDDGVGSGTPQSTVTNSQWVLITEANMLPVIGNAPDPLVVDLAEDCGETNLLAVLNLVATDGDAGHQDALEWTNLTASAYGVLTVSGVGSNPAAITYTPSEDWYGTNLFTVRVTDTVGGFDEIGVQMQVAPLNDAPVNTALPGITGTRTVGNTLTVTNGLWNDNADTNAAYTHDVFTNTAAFSYQWYTSANSSGASSNAITDATNATYTLVSPTDRYQYFAVKVTCMDRSNGVPENASTTAWTAWLQELSVIPTVVVFTNTLNDGAWGSASNWAPDAVPSATISAVIGDTAVLSPATVSLASGAAAAKNLYLGTNANSQGTLNMTGGTLTLPAAGNLTVAGATSSTGTLNQIGGSIGGITSGDLSIAAGNSSKGEMVLGGSGTAITSTWSVAGGQYSDGTLTVSNAYWRQSGSAARTVGGAAGAIGRLYVQSNAVMDFMQSGSTTRRDLILGSVEGSTGVLEVAGSGILTNIAVLYVGGTNGGYGQVIVSNSGSVYVGSTTSVRIGGTNNNSIIRVYDTGYIKVYDATHVGNSDYSSGTLELNGGVYSSGLGASPAMNIGKGDYSLGTVSINGGTLLQLWSTSREWCLGAGIGSTGALTIASGVASNSSSGSLSLGYTNNSLGEVNLQGGTLYVGGGMTVGAYSSALGRVQVTGGDWRQVGALNIGTVAGGTGLVSVANCRTATNITGAITVGGGATEGDRYGSITLSNATFGDGTRVMVLTNGVVELTGTGSVFICNSFTNNGGFVTNHVRQFSGGLNITNRLDTSLAILDGGKIHLSFEGNSDALPADVCWGLRWAGTNGYPVLTNYLDTGLITVTNLMTGSRSNQVLTVNRAEDNSYTYIGFLNATAPVINGGATAVETNVNEDGVAYLTNLLWASDVDGTSWTWTNTTTPANGTVAVNGSGTNPVNWSVFTYTPNANFNGTNTFQVRVMDDIALSDSITVTVVVAAVNDVPTNTALPGIVGNGLYGSTWTATNGVWNDNLDTNAGYTHASFTNQAVFTYQWLYSNGVAGVAIADATNATFVPTAVMAGSNIGLRVTCTDGNYGVPGSTNALAYSAYVPVAAPANDPPVNTTVPGIVGNTSYGTTWTATNGVWNDNLDTNMLYTHADFTSTAGFTYQWQYSNDVDIANETNVTFAVTPSMLGTNIRVKVTCTDAAYGVPASTSSVAYSAYRTVTEPSLLVFNKTLDTWANGANWTPEAVPSIAVPAVIGDTTVRSPATAAIEAVDTAAVKDLYLGTNANSQGTLNMTGGSLTFPAAGRITVAGATSSTGVLNQTGGTIGGITNGSLTIASGISSKGSVLLGGSTAITSTWAVASGANSDGILALVDYAYWRQGENTARTVGSAAGAMGRLTVGSNAVMDFLDFNISPTPRDLILGSVYGSTGILEVVGSGVLTNIATLSVGGVSGGYGQVIVSNSGKVYSAGGTAVRIGSTNNNSIIKVYDSGYIRALSYTYIGNSAYSSGTLELNGGIYSCGTLYNPGMSIGQGDYSLGTASINGGTLLQPTATSRPWWLGSGIGSTGVLTIASGLASNNAGALLVGYTNNSVGEVYLQGGTLYVGDATTVGANSSAVGRVQITGGVWRQVGALDIGTVAGATGQVNVANCRSATNLTGAITVGGGATVGDRYGSITLTNATFGGGSRVMVLTNGFVTLAGTGSVLRCNSFTNDGGFVTNYVRRFAGGVDVTNAAASALVLTTGGKMHLAFEEGPVRDGDFWGLRWKGAGNIALVAGMTNSGALTWDDAAVAGMVRIYSNATHTLVGFEAITEGPVFSIK